MAAAANLVPAALIFYFIHRYGIDVPFWDEWDAFAIPLQRLHQGTLDFATLSGQFHEHRPVFPRLLTLANATLFHWNRTVEMYVTAALFVLCACVLFRFMRTYWQRPATSLLFVPVAWTLLSWRQSENLLWGFQTCFGLLAAGTVLAFCLLHRARAADRFVLGASLAAFVASFSAAGGLFLWPIGLAQLLLQRWYGEPDDKPRSGAFAAWTGAGVLSWAFFFFGYHQQVVAWPTGLAFLLRNPIASVRFVAGMLASPISDRQLVAQPLGLILMAVGAWAFVRLWRVGTSKDRLAAAPLLALLAFTVLNAVLCCDRRMGLGLGQSLASRYCSLTALGLVSLYALLARFARTERRPTTWLACAGMAVLLMSGAIACYIEWRHNPPGRLETFALWSYALRNDALVSDEAVASVYWHPELVRQRTPFMRAQGYSLFHRDVPAGLPARYSGTVSGCAIDPLNDIHRRIDSASLRVTGRVQQPGRIFLGIDNRIDVPALPDAAGFVAYVRASLLTAGEHALVLKIVSPDGGSYSTCGATHIRVNQ